MRSILLAGAVVLAFALPATPAFALPPVGHVFVIVLEYKGIEDTFGPTGQLNAPYLSRELPAQGQRITLYHGIAHSSLDFPIAMPSGQPPPTKTKADCP